MARPQPQTLNLVGLLAESSASERPGSSRSWRLWSALSDSWPATPARRPQRQACTFVGLSLWQLTRPDTVYRKVQGPLSSHRMQKAQPYLRDVFDWSPSFDVRKSWPWPWSGEGLRFTCLVRLFEVVGWSTPLWFVVFSRVLGFGEIGETYVGWSLCFRAPFWRLLLSNGPPFFVFQDGIVRYSSNSKIDSPTWVFLQQKIQCLAPVSSCRLNTDHSVVSFLISPSSIFTEVPRVHCQSLEEALSDCCCCGCECCCCECHQLLRVTCGGGRSVECLSNNVRSSF